MNALSAAGSSVYVGGQFTHVDGAAQRGVARLALDGSRVAAFTGHLDDGLVDTLVVHGAHVYVGGRFSRVGGVARGLAALNPTTGAPDASLTVGVAQLRSTSSLPFVRRSTSPRTVPRWWSPATSRRSAASRATSWLSST